MVEPKSKIEIEEKKTEGTKRGRPPADAPTFPRDSLNAAVEVAKAIRRDGSGDPINPILLANSLKTTRRSNKYVVLLNSSERYGLTTGSVYSKTIALTELGKALVVPTDEITIGTNLRRALLQPKLFNDFFTNTDKKPIQREVFLKNTLEMKYKVRKVDVNACYDILMKNIREHNIVLKQGQEELLWLDNLGKAATVVPSVVQTAEHEIAGVEDGTLPQQEETTPQAPPAQEAVVKVPRVFISHSKNKKILDNIKQMLTFGKFDYRVAEEKETLSMPLSDKVFGLMQDCNCAIINVSADQERKQGEGYGINENVLIEIGAAFLHYNRRVLLVIDQKFKDKLPSILQGITAIFYEGHELSLSDGMKLMQALGEFRNKL